MLTLATLSDNTDLNIGGPLIVLYNYEAIAN